MFNPALAVRTQTVKTQTINSRVNLANEPRPEASPLSRIDIALEYRLLNTLPKIETRASDTPQTASTCRLQRTHVVGHQHQHQPAYFQKKAG